MTIEKWIVTKGMHLGFIKENVGVNAVIEHDIESRRIKIAGMDYDTDKDLMILKKHGWVEKLTKKIENEIAKEEEEKELEEVDNIMPVHGQIKGERTIKGMEIIKSDSDLMEREIDIRHTKNRPPEHKQKRENLEIIRGDETQPERVARLQREKADLPIVKDDESYSADNRPSLNEGQIEKKTAIDIQKIRQENLEKSKKHSNEVTKSTKKKAGRPKGSKNKKEGVVRKARKVAVEEVK